MTGRLTHEAEETLRTYQFMIESAHDAIFFKDLESRYIIVNNKTLEAFGLPKEDVIGKNDYELMPDKKEAKKNVDDDQIVFKSAKPTEVTKHMTRADGKEYWFQAIKVPQFDNNGNVIGLVGVARDITKQKRIEEALKESEEKYRNLIERANDGVIIVQDGIVKFVNNRTADLFGFGVGEIQNTPFLDYVSPDERKRIKELHEQRLKGKDVPDIYEMQALHKDGRKLDIETNSGIITYHGKPSVLAFIRDITERKRTEEELHENKSKLSAMLTSIGDHMSMLDKNLNILWANEIAEKIFGNDIIGKKCYEVYHKRTEPCEPYPCIAIKAFQNGKIHEHETQVIDKDGKTIFFQCTANVALRDKEGKPTAVLEISRDITEKVRADNALKKAKDDLEHRVKKRTRELEVKTKSLEELNTAMKVLLKKREEDKTELEDNVLVNLKEMIDPYFDKLKKTKLDDEQSALLSIMETNLNEITSPFTRKMSAKHLNLTPKEKQIANHIKHGKTTKQIAKLMNASPRTIDTHRKNIRKKTGLRGQRGNLRSYLLSLH
jgi:PAS domain S-box-containing protein